MVRDGFTRPENGTMYWKEFIEQCNDIGIRSLPIVLSISLFLGMVMILQFFYQFVSPFIHMTVLASLVRDTAILELCPMIVCVVLAGVIGSKIASELGNMRVTEQIDALEIMGVNTKSYLILPKVFAAMVMIPSLIVISISVCIFGGYFAGVYAHILTHEQFTSGVSSGFLPYNLFFALVKSFVFSVIITVIPAFFGYYVKGSALEIGKASTAAVVVSCVMILISDYVLSVLML